MFWSRKKLMPSPQIIDDYLRSELDFLRQRLGDEIAQLRAEIHELRSREENARLLQAQRLNTVEAVVSGLERIVALFDGKDPPSGQATASQSATSAHSPNSSSALELSYLLLENRFRGAPEVIRQRLVPYLDFFAETQFPVLEIGAGRGEFQSLFREHGIKSYGYELDLAMVETCRAQGLDVHYGDGIAHLSRCADGALGGIVAIQVVEHLPYQLLKEFLRLARTKLVRDGLILLETINTKSLVALSQNYFRDPTHAHPLHPETLSYILQMSGFTLKNLGFTSPFPQAAKLQEVSTDPLLPPRWNNVLQQFNHVVSTLNQLLFAEQDYYILAAPACEAKRSH